MSRISDDELAKAIHRTNGRIQDAPETQEREAVVRRLRGGKLSGDEIARTTWRGQAENAHDGNMRYMSWKERVFRLLADEEC